MAGGPRCCMCSRKGRCVSSSCVKDGRLCSNCLPNVEGRCGNLYLPPAASGPSFVDNSPRVPLSARSNLAPPNDDHDQPSPTGLYEPLLSTTVSSVVSSISYDEISEADIVSPSCHTPTSLPDFSPLADPDFQWGDIDGEVCCSQMKLCYNEVVRWKKNVFKVPQGRVGVSFVSELARLFQAYANSSTLETVALYAVMVIPHLLLQRPPGKSKSKDLSKHLDRRLTLWADGDIESLLHEGRAIQSRLKPYPLSTNSDNLTRRFTNLMLVGNVKAAIRLLSDSENGKVLSLDTPVDGKSVKDILLDKHPPGHPPILSAISAGNSSNEFHPILFDSITPDLIRSVVLKSSGSSGPSGLDAAAWKRLCTSFRSSNDLCNALSSLAKRLCTSYVDPEGLFPFLASRLIAIDKLPGVRPIGVGEVVRRIVGKAVLSVVGQDILDVTGTDQLSAGQPGGSEAAVHAVRSMFDHNDCEAILLVDARNAFNSLNRSLALLNVSILCPAVAAILINSYRSGTPLFIDGDVLFSSEGITQGDPLAMVMYAIGVLPLIHHLNQFSLSQVWYADDAAAIGKLHLLRDWWDELFSCGPVYGYFVNPAKSWLIVKSDVVDTAKSIFEGTDVNITSDGHRYLGSPIGSDTFVSTFVHDKIVEWVGQIEKLVDIAKTQPHVVYSCLLHGFFGKFVYLFRTTPNISEYVDPLEKCIHLKLIPSLTGQEGIRDVVRSILTLPSRFGGMGFIDPSRESLNQYHDSVYILSPLVNSIIQKSDIPISSVYEEILIRKNEVKRDHQSQRPSISS